MNVLNPSLKLRDMAREPRQGYGQQFVSSVFAPVAFRFFRVAAPFSEAAFLCPARSTLPTSKLRESARGTT